MLISEMASMLAISKLIPISTGPTVETEKFNKCFTPNLSLYFSNLTRYSYITCLSLKLGLTVKVWP